MREPELSTSSSIFDTVDSPKGFVVRTRISPLRFMQPLMISSPSAMSRGRLSPVRALVFTVELPEMTTPSIGTFSARLHDYDAAGLDLVGIDLLELSVKLDVGIVRADIHEACN